MKLRLKEELQFGYFLKLATATFDYILAQCWALATIIVRSCFSFWTEHCGLMKWHFYRAYSEGTLRGCVAWNEHFSRAVMCDARSIAKSKEKL